jgi:PEP-CTERM motif
MPALACARLSLFDTPKPPRLATTNTNAMNKTLSLAALALACLGAQSVSAQVNPDLNTWTCVGACGASAADGDITLSPLGNAKYGYVTTFGSSELGLSPLNLEDSHGAETNGSTYTSAAFTLAAQTPIDAYFNYVSTDGKSFDDYAWARLVNTNNNTAVWLFTARSENGGKSKIVPGGVVDTSDFDTDVIVNYDDIEFNTRNVAINDTINWSRLGDFNGTCWRDDAEGCGFTGWMHSSVRVNAGTYRLEVGVVNFVDQIYHSGLAFDIAGLTAPVPEPATWALMLGGMALLAARRRRQD